MFRISALRAAIRFMMLLGFVMVGVFGLAACNATGTSPTDPTAGRPTATAEPVRPRATSTPRIKEDPTSTPVEEDEPTATPEEEDEPTPTVRVRATPTTEEEPTPEEGEPTQVSAGGFVRYDGPEGDWSIEYPEDWQVIESPPNYQFLETTGEAFVQLTYTAGGGQISNEELADIATAQFESSFENYSEYNREVQSDDSVRIDFTFSAGGIDWDAQVFIEGRQGDLYMLLLATTEDAFQAGTYQKTIDYMIGSYELP